MPRAAFDHQRKNAFEFAKGGKAVVLDQENLTPNLFLDEIANLITNSKMLKQMGEKAKAFYKPNTPELIAREIKSVVPKG